MAPKISVILPVYNAEKFLLVSIGSILQQTFSDLELIIINDGSTDRSADIINSILDNRIVFINNEINQGTALVSNQGLSVAQGDFIALMDADDFSFPDRFQKQVDFMNANAEVGILGTASIFSDTKRVLTYPTNDLSLRRQMFFRFPFRNPTLMLRHAVIREHGLQFNPDFKYTLDYEFISRMIGFTRAANLTDPLLTYQVHDSQTSTLKHEIFIKHANDVGLFMLGYLGVQLTPADQVIHLSLKNNLVNFSNFGKAEENYLAKLKFHKSLHPLFHNINTSWLVDRLHPVRKQIITSKRMKWDQVRFLFRHTGYFSTFEIIKYCIKAIVR